MKILENNIVTISGEIMGNFEFSHEVCGEGFYTSTVASRRTSGADDFVPITVSKRLVDVSREWGGETVRILGNFRSYNRHEEEKNRLILSVFVREFEPCELTGDDNEIFLSGYICKEPVYRKTPFGREIADLLLAVNRPYSKSDYIPCICWGRNAKYAGNFNVGDRCDIWGRIQSREYSKKLPDGSFERRIAYEVSISKIERIKEEE